MAQGASTAGVLAVGYGGLGASLLPTTAGNTLFTTDGTNWSSAPKIVQSTSQATTSGTSITFSSIPSWVKRITIMFNDVKSDGTSGRLIQIGSGSVQSTGYVSSSCFSNVSNQAGGVSSTAGFIIYRNVATDLTSGIMVLSSFGSNIWVSNHACKNSTALCCFGGGNVTLSGTLDRIVLTNALGTNAFNAGSVNILYE